MKKYFKKNLRKYLTSCFATLIMVSTYATPLLASNSQDYYSTEKIEEITIVRNYNHSGTTLEDIDYYSYSIVQEEEATTTKFFDKEGNLIATFTEFSDIKNVPMSRSRYVRETAVFNTTVTSRRNVGLGLTTTESGTFRVTLDISHDTVNSRIHSVWTELVSGTNFTRVLHSSGVNSRTVRFSAANVDPRYVTWTVSPLGAITTRGNN